MIRTDCISLVLQSNAIKTFRSTKRKNEVIGNENKKQANTKCKNN
jgi:hypothetical protein